MYFLDPAVKIVNVSFSETDEKDKDIVEYVFEFTDDKNDDKHKTWTKKYYYDARYIVVGKSVIKDPKGGFKVELFEKDRTELFDKDDRSSLKKDNRMTIKSEINTYTYKIKRDLERFFLFFNTEESAKEFIDYYFQYNRAKNNLGTSKINLHNADNLLFEMEKSKKQKKEDKH